MSQICRFYLKGACKYGNSCHFIHENNYYSKNKDYSDNSYGYNRNSYNENYNRNYNENYNRSNYNDNYRGDSYNKNYNRNSYNENYNQNNYNENYSSYRNQDNYSSYESGQPFNKNYNRYHVDHRQQSKQPEIKPEELNASQLLDVIRTEVKQFEDRHVWKLTVICPIKNYGNIPGFQDYSPEEIRLQFYTASNNNSLHEFNTMMEEMRGNLIQNCQLLKNNVSAYNIVRQMMSKSVDLNEESTNATQTQSTFTFDLKALAQQNKTELSQPSSFPSTNAFNSFSFAQPPSFNASNGNQVDWNNCASFPGTQPQVNSQINSFSFNLNNLNSQVTAPAAPSVFPTATQVPLQENNSYYSKMEDLLPDELLAFQSPTFKYGQIPLNPPPKELCPNKSSFSY